MKIYFSFFLLLLFIACNESGKLEGQKEDVQLTNNKKWRTGTILESLLRGKPKEVEERLYLNLSDTSLNATGRQHRYTLSRFDSAGNIVFEKGYFDTSRIVESHFSFKWEGVRVKYLFFKNGVPQSEKNETVAERIEKNKYRISHYFNGLKTGTEIETFSDNGDTVTVESAGPGRDTSTSSSTLVYKNGLLIRSLLRNGSVVTDRRYYYSAQNFLDSTSELMNGHRTDETIYTNNVHGDPLQSIRFGSHKYIKYEYDEKGNWVKALIYEPGRQSDLDIGSKFRDYSLIIRRITY